MGALDQTFANSVLDATWDQSGASVRLATGPIHCRLMTANGSATAAGTELATSGGYTSGTGSPTVTANGAGSGSKASNSAVTGRAVREQDDELRRHVLDRLRQHHDGLFIGISLCYRGGYATREEAILHARAGPHHR
jgi:hypothetical protein